MLGASESMPAMRAETKQPTGTESEVLQELAAFPLLEALYGRRSRRFALGTEIPDGPLAYRSKHEPIPLTELERMLVLIAMGGTTGWHYSITRHARYAPMCRTTPAVPLGARSRRRLVSTLPSSSSQTTLGSTSSRRGTPARWLIPRRST